MTTVELADATRSEVERIRSAVAGLGLTPERIQEIGGHMAAAAESRGTGIRDRVAAARDRIARDEPAPRRGGVSRVVGVTVRTLGLAWAALMLSTLTMALVSRSSARRATAAVEPDADEIQLRTVLGPMAFTSRATAFRGGLIDCWYGGGFVDLREATLDPNGAVLRVRAIFGGGQIVVPGGWRVSARVRGIGGLNDSRPHAELATDAPHLAIEGLALFGGFTVQSDLSAETIAELEKAVARMADPAPLATEPGPNQPLATEPVPTV